MRLPCARLGDELKQSAQVLGVRVLETKARLGDKFEQRAQNLRRGRGDDLQQRAQLLDSGLGSGVRLGDKLEQRAQILGRGRGDEDVAVAQRQCARHRQAQRLPRNVTY